MAWQAIRTDGEGMNDVCNLIHAGEPGRPWLLFGELTFGKRSEQLKAELNHARLDVRVPHADWMGIYRSVNLQSTNLITHPAQLIQHGAAV